MEVWNGLKHRRQLREQSTTTWQKRGTRLVGSIGQTKEEVSVFKRSIEQKYEQLAGEGELYWEYTPKSMSYHSHEP